MLVSWLLETKDVNCFCPDLKHNPKKFFSFNKSRKCENIGVAPLREAGVIKIGNNDKARILNNQFCSVFTTDDGKIPTMTDNEAQSMSEIEICPNGIKKLLCELNPHKASGPDNVQARLLKKTCNKIAKGMALLFQAFSTKLQFLMNGGMLLLHHYINLVKMTVARQKLIVQSP